MKNSPREADMKNIIRLTFAVAVICALAGLGMTSIHRLTKDRIQLAEQAARTAKMKLILPDGAMDTTKISEDDAPVELYAAADKGGATIGYAAIATSRQGFGGNVTVIAGIDMQGAITGVIVDKHNETPGIGSRAVERKQIQSFWKVLAGKGEKVAVPPNAYLDSYCGKSLTASDFQSLGKDIQGITGATFSSKAVLDAINQISQYWQTHSIR